MRLLGKKEIDYITVGAAILATGGGGDPYIGKLMALCAIKKYGPIKLLSVCELLSDALLVSVGMIGAPTVMMEKIPNGSEALTAFKTLALFLDKKITAIYPIEAGGMNSLLPLAAAAQLSLPVVDVDGMGRAFPEFQMTTFYLADITASPFVIVDEKLNVNLTYSLSGLTTERYARAVCNKMGGSAIFAGYPITKSDAKRAGILNSLSFEQKIGEEVERARIEKRNVVTMLVDLLKGFMLFKGKISRVDRKVKDGFNLGTVYFSTDDKKSAEVKVSFQNEYLLAQKGNTLLCATPDLIILLDAETGDPILTERLRYGMRVVGIGVPADEKWRTPYGIKVAGPRYFSYDIDFEPVEHLINQ